MADFNFEKAYCVFVVPAWEALPNHVLDVASKVRALVGELRQGYDLNIPMSPAIKGCLNELSTQELAELARVHYYAGHWSSSALPSLFDNKRGESWKVANCCDQVLRERLDLPETIEVHEGRLRVTFRGLECWLWEEFGLATDDNLEAYKSCGLEFLEDSLEDSASVLRSQIGDLWPDPDTVPDSPLYETLKQAKQEQERKQIEKRFKDKIARLEQDKKAAQKEIEFFIACNDRGVSVENVIYYKHTDTFCFGWRESLDADEVYSIDAALEDIRGLYNIEYK